jgi:site-specific recombinase XerD
MKHQHEFETYLKSMFPSDYDVEVHLKNVRYYNEWLEANHIIDILNAPTTDILAYIKFTQSIGTKTGTLNTRLNSFRKYYDCMIKLGYITKNPALNINIRGQESKVVANPLDAIALNTLYENFASFLDNRPKPLRIKLNVDEFTKQKYKLIISLMIYQGLDVGELNRLCVSDVNVKVETIYVASKSRRNSRTLKLESSQSFLFYQYLQSLPSTQENLFGTNVEQCLRYSLPCLRGLQPKLINAEHIRQSRIMVWVSTEKLLEAQYLIGHVYVSSTEHYQQQDITGLVNQINMIDLFK